MDSNNDHIAAPGKFENLEIDRKKCLSDIENLVQNHEVTLLNCFRPDKKLLVLDVDVTLTCDDGTPRPYLHEMLMVIYKHYDIILWSAEGEDSYAKIEFLNTLNTSCYNFVCHLNNKVMIEITSNRYGKLHVKPLDFIWKKFPQFSAKNTVILDDVWQSYALNRQSGMSTDRQRSSYDSPGELKRVADYLESIADFENFAVLHHNDWENNLDSIYGAMQSFPTVRIADDEWTLEDISTNSTITFRLSVAPQSSISSHQAPLLRDPIDEASTSDPNSSGEVKTPDFPGPESAGPELCQNDDSKKTMSVDSEHSPSDSNPDKSDDITDEVATCDIPLIHILRAGKKLLVLDFAIIGDWTVTDYLSLASIRPYLHEFLSRVYVNYDIAIWSKQSRKWTENALTQIGIMDDSNFKISFYLTADEVAMTTESLNCYKKVLEVIWHNIPRFSAGNTVMINDRAEDLQQNSQSEVSVKPYTDKRERIDIELALLSAYLDQIVYVKDFTILNHSIWRDAEKVFKLIETGDVELGSRDMLVKVVYWDKTLKLQDIKANTSIKTIKDSISKLIGVPSEMQTLRFDIPQFYVAFEYIQRNHSFGTPRVVPKRRRDSFDEDRSHITRSFYTRDSLQESFYGDQTIRTWSRQAVTMLQLNGPIQLPDISIDEATNERILKIELDSVNPKALDDAAPFEEAVPPETNMLNITPCNPEIYAFTIEELVNSHEIIMWNPLRVGKKLLILDIDYTLYDADQPTFPIPTVLMKRPYLDEFLARAYAHYDIALWTEQNEEKTLNAVDKILKANSDRYKIAFCLSHTSMVTITTHEYGSIDVKPLEIIWRKFPAYSAKNTIVVDDHEWNFAMNHQSGYKIERYQVMNRDTDKELRILASYLEIIASMQDFTQIRHRPPLLPGKLVEISPSGEMMARDYRVCVIVEWKENQLVFINVHIDTTAEELKTIIANLIDIPVSRIELKRNSDMYL